MESHIEEVREELEHLEHMPVTRRRVVVTAAVLAVTMMATLAAALAAVASSHEGTAIRDRQQAAAAASTAQLAYEDAYSYANDRISESDEASYMSQWLRYYGQQDSGSVAAQLDRQAAAARSVSKAVQSGSPTTQANLPIYQTRLQVPVDVAQATSAAYGTQASGWLARENSYLATISMLAVALFLLGLALTIPHKQTGTGFIALAAVLLVFSVGRIALTAAGSVTTPSRTAISDYANAEVNLYNGDYTGAQRLLHHALALRPGFAAAWHRLGDVHYYEGLYASDARAARTDFAAAAVGYGQAAHHGAQSSIAYNDLGYAQLLADQTAAASGSLRHALAIDPGDDIAITSIAENDLVAGNLPAALAELNLALRNVVRHGPEFQHTWFGDLRPDQDTLTLVGVPANLVDPFFLRVKEAEASLDDVNRVTPLATHGATFSNFTVKAAGAPLTSYVIADFSYQGLQVGDIVSLKYFQYGQFEAAPSNSWQVGDQGSLTAGSGSLSQELGSYPAAVPSGPTTVELYLNGNLMAQTTVTMS